MKIDKYSYEDIDAGGFKLGEVKFSKMNLLVGYSGSGKTRLLNTIFNLGKVAVNPESYKTGHWTIEFVIERKNFSWELRIERNKDEEIVVVLEKLKDLSSNKLIVERTIDLFKYNNIELPKLKKSETSISLLRDEKVIKPIILGFSRILIRSFSHDHKEFGYLDYQPLSTNILKIMEKKYNVFEKLLSSSSSLNILMYALKSHDIKHFNIFRDYYKEIFPNIEDVDVKDISFFNPKSPNLETPIICIKEKNVDTWIEFNRLSSGMQKVFVLMVDVSLARNSEWIFLIDEYENSLGPKIIDFYYNWIQYVDSPHQFILTSHHPYVINNIPTSNWYVCSRKGSNVEFIYGERLFEISGKSNQTAFTKLLNSPLYKREYE
jgi:predicted ATP-dependent endonuclease of OLD family